MQDQVIPVYTSGDVHYLQNLAIS